MIYFEKLQQYLEAKSKVEIIADKEVTGILSDVGDDYLTIVYAIERKIEEQIEIAEGDKAGTFEKQTRIEVSEVETVLRLADIKSVSKIIRTKSK